MVNLARLANSGSLYEQLISQTLSIESQPRLKLRAAQTEQTVFKGILSDFGSRASALDTVLDKLRDPFRSPFAARAASAAEDAGFSATAASSAAPGQHEIQVTRLARADARLSRQVERDGADVAALFADAGDPAVMGERSFTIRIAQPQGEAVALGVRYTPPEGATNDDVLAGLAAAVTSATQAARADGRLAEGTGVSASVVRETSGTARLSVRGLATGYGQRLQFDDPDGVLAALEVNRADVRQGAGGGAVYDVGTGAQDSALNAAFTLDGLSIYRDSNTVADALDGVTLTLSKVTDQASALTVGADVKGMRSEVDAFIEAYNGLNTFLTTKTKVDADSGKRGELAGDAAMTGLRLGLRTDLSQGSGGLRLADLGITTERDGTLKLSDPAALDAALAASPAAVGALFSADGGPGARLGDRIDGLLGSQGTIARRKEGADARIRTLGSQIERWDAKLSRRETTLRDQFAQLEVIATQAQAQQTSLNSLFFF